MCSNTWVNLIPTRFSKFYFPPSKFQSLVSGASSIKYSLRYARLAMCTWMIQEKAPSLYMLIWTLISLQYWIHDIELQFSLLGDLWHELDFKLYCMYIQKKTIIFPSLHDDNSLGSKNLEQINKNIPKAHRSVLFCGGFALDFFVTVTVKLSWYFWKK